MSNVKNKKYSFRQTITGLEAFVATFEKKIHEIHDDIPVMIFNTGDETYFFKQKFEKIDQDKKTELYLKTPRIVIDLEDATLQTDQNTSQYTTVKYLYDSGVWEGQFRRQSLLFPISINFVTPNFIRSLEYFDMLASILSIDNVFTYKFLGNNHDASFNAQNFSFEKATMDQSSTSRNFVVKAALELNLQIWYPRYNTLKRLDTFNDKEDDIQFGILTQSNSGDKQLDNIKIIKDDDSCS